MSKRDVSIMTSISIVFKNFLPWHVVFLRKPCKEVFNDKIFDNLVLQHCSVFCHRTIWRRTCLGKLLVCNGVMYHLSCTPVSSCMRKCVLETLMLSVLFFFTIHLNFSWMYLKKNQSSDFYIFNSDALKILPVQNQQIIAKHLWRVCRLQPVFFGFKNPLKMCLEIFEEKFLDFRFGVLGIDSRHE